MIPGIISLLSAALAFLFWWLKRRASQAADPRLQNQKRYEQIDLDIALASKPNASKPADTLRISAHADADLDELERLQRSGGDQRRSN